MNSKIKKLLVTGLALASFGLMGCEPSKDAEGPVNITVTDADGNKYPTMKIGQQIWMAKNLNVNIEGSVCYDNDPANCEKYGRLYDWEAARNACPSGWHLPSKDDFESFLNAVKLRLTQIETQKKLNAETLRDGETSISKNLRSTEWENGFDTFGFAALPAGHYDGNRRRFGSLEGYTRFWSSTEDNDRYGYDLDVRTRQVGVFSDKKYYSFPVRCLRD